MPKQRKQFSLLRGLPWLRIPTGQDDGESSVTLTTEPGNRSDYRGTLIFLIDCVVRSTETSATDDRKLRTASLRRVPLRQRMGTWIRFGIGSLQKTRSTPDR